MVATEYISHLVDIKHKIYYEFMKGLSYMYNKNNKYDMNNTYDMSTFYRPYPCNNYPNIPMYNAGSIYNTCNSYPCNPYANLLMNNQEFWNQMANEYFANPYGNQNTAYIDIKDYGPDPLAINIEQATKQNSTFRTALWTGKYLQVTLMSINVGEDIGLEVHPHLDQFIRIEEGQGIVRMGDSKNNLDFQAHVEDDFAFIIPAGKWHNLVNTGKKPLKLYSIYAPPQHPHGTVHATKADAEAAEHDH